MRRRHRDVLEADILRLLDETHLGSLRTLADHARFYLNQGNLSEARRLIEDIKAVQKERTV